MSASLLDPTRGARLLEAARPSRVFWQPASATPPNVRLFGLTFENETISRAAANLVRTAAAAQRLHVVFVNAHVVNVMRHELRYGEIVANVDRLYADGSGLAIAARLHGQTFIDNVNGTDLFPRLCCEAANNGVKIFLLGGDKGIAALAAETVAAVGYGAAIAGTHHGYFAKCGEEEARLIDDINASGASILLVGMGVPLQEQWIARNAPRLKRVVQLGGARSQSRRVKIE